MTRASPTGPFPLPDPNIPIVGVDLDSTLAESVWPQRRVIGPPIPEGVELVRHYGGLGYRVVIYTARPAIDKEYIWAWVRYHDLPIDDVFTDKPFLGLLVDDRAWCPGYTKDVKKPVIDRGIWEELEPEDIEEAGK